MGYVKTKGIVIRECNTGEADKIITLFTSTAGKLSCFAKGARRTKSNLISGTQLLSYSDFVLFKGRDTYSVSSCNMIEPFYEIRNDMVKLTYAAHIVDILNDVIQENLPAYKVQQLFLNCLHMLAKTERSPELVARIFELRMLSMIGFAPYAKGCVFCGETEIGNTCFSFEKCGFVCANCIQNEPVAVEISNGTVRAIQHIVYAPIKSIFNFTVSDQILEELGRIARRYLKSRLEKEYTKLSFLKGL